MLLQVFAVLLMGAMPLGQGGVSAGPITVDGCVQGSGSRITLFGEHMGDAFLLEGDAAQLASLSGRRARISGNELPPDRDRPPRDLPRLRVRQVRELAGTCPPEGAARGAQPSGISGHEGAATPRYRSPGTVSRDVIPPGGAANVNRSAEGAPSAGTNDPRNLANSPPPIPPEVEKRTAPQSKKKAKHKPAGSDTGSKSSPH